MGAELKNDIGCLVTVQNLTTKAAAGRRRRENDKRLCYFGIFFLRLWRARGNLSATFEIVKALSGIKCEELFTLIPDRCTTGHSLRLQHNHTTPQMRAGFLTSKMILIENRLQRQAVSSNNLNGYKESLDAGLKEFVSGWTQNISVGSETAPDSLFCKLPTPPDMGTPVAAS